MYQLFMYNIYSLYEMKLKFSSKQFLMKVNHVKKNVPPYIQDSTTVENLDYYQDKLTYLFWFSDGS